MIKVKGLLKVFGFKGDGGEVMGEKWTRGLKVGLVLCEWPETSVDFEAVFGFEAILSGEKHWVVSNNNLKVKWV